LAGNIIARSVFAVTTRVCLLDTGRAAEALPLAQTALATHETTSGPNHPWKKDSARIVADALDVLGRDEEEAAVRTRCGIET
jgi:hypothetical protein